MPVSPRRILGMDPSLRATGLAIVETAGGRATVVCRETVRIPASWTHSRALHRLRQAVEARLASEAPAAAAIESPFFSRNARTALALGEARGVLLAACAAAGVPVFEYAPRAVKRAVTGRGEAPKEQVQRMVRALTGFESDATEDETDAIAAAICHAYRRDGAAGREV